MIDIIEEKHSELVEMCRTHHVRRLELFGSATLADHFDPRTSDLDFLVEFEPSDEMNPADQYFGLWQGLQNLFGLHVDLVTVRSLRNPYFIRAVNATREPVYAS